VGNFVNISSKPLFVKSDINVDKSNFQTPKKIDFNKTVKFFYIVGPHFESIHKNFEVFVRAMTDLKEEGFDFEIIISLTKEQLYSSNLWNRSLDICTNFLGYASQQELVENFQNNTVLVSTSIIETLGLHVIEAIQNGVLVIVPNERYSLDVYGSDTLTYEIFNYDTLVKVIKDVKFQNSEKIRKIVRKNQNFLKNSEKSKLQNIVEVFNVILKKDTIIEIYQNE
jgi:glycosyltransferase involved in cell wall biosynthesis